ncbi:glucosyltransferase domain-containing protein [Latilactobacillus curvatus]|uniref:glucosyltransferase domain-containing protein n=1 Tax=Latilactobacillus curvatus TaxID=28038 RepID=UPI0024DF77B2|nr:glucosyltransferase domain-containing protein [Latilactobacillus curvatus]WIE01166.1 glucosyltransferase domain-containing protein [Latilactobacillus curvatus]
MLNEVRYLYQFCKKKWGVVLSVYLMTFLLYLPKLASFNYSIDTEHLIINPKETLESWIRLGRFGLVALKRLSLYGLDINVFFINAVTYLLLATSGVLLFYLINRVARVPQYIQVAGILVYISSPIHFEQTNFILQSSEVVLAYVLLFLAFIVLGEQGKWQWHKILTSVLLTVISFSIYPSLFIGFLTLTVVLNQLALMGREKKQEFIQYIISFRDTIVVFCSSFFIYQILNRLVLKLYHTQITSYITDASAWKNNDFNIVFKEMKELYNAYYLNNNQPFHFELLTYIGIIAIILVFIRGIFAKNINWFVMLDLIWLYIFSFSLLLLLGNTIGPIRTMTPTVPIVLMIDVMTILSMINVRYLKKMGVVLTSVFILSQLKTTSDMEQTEIVDYQAMANYSNQLIDRINQLGIRDTQKYKLIIVGSKKFESPLKLRGDVVGTTFYDWDESSLLGNNERVQGYLGSQGYQFESINGQDYTDAINRSESMLVFPDKKGIQVVGNKIIVKVNG